MARPDRKVRHLCEALTGTREGEVSGLRWTALSEERGVRVLRIRHNPTRRLPEQHVGFLIGETRTVLHVGDADPMADNFAVLATAPPVDVALLPYWYVLTESSRRMVTTAIAPRQIVAMHMPVAERAALAQALARTDFKVASPGTPGQLVTLAP